MYWLKIQTSLFYNTKIIKITKNHSKYTVQYINKKIYKTITVNIYSDQVNNGNLYANKLFYGEEGEQVENLGDQVAGEEDDKSEKDLLRDCRDDEAKAAKADVDKLKKQVQEEREKVEQTKNEAS